ncbi:MAG: hypothetical protein ACI35V_08425 [Sphingobacterium composti]
MFLSLSKIDVGTYQDTRLINPINPNNPLVLTFYRTKSHAAFFTVYSKQVEPVFWDGVTQKRISRGKWSQKMHAFVKRNINDVQKPPFIFKFTIVGWIFVLALIGFFSYLTYNGLKPAGPKSERFVAMHKNPVAGDIYFGRFEQFKTKDDRIAYKNGFGWFKVVKVDDSAYYMSKSKEMSKSALPKESLNSVDFENESVPVLIKELGFQISMESVDGLLEVYLTDKK